MSAHKDHKEPKEAKPAKGKEAKPKAGKAPGKTGLAPPCTMVIFGATGDLAKRKVLPALYNLRKEGMLPDNFAILENGRKPISPAETKKRMAESLHEFVARESFDQAVSDWFVERVEYLAGDPAEDATYAQLKKKIEQINKKYSTGGNVLFYLATPPDLFDVIPGKLGKAGLLEEKKEEDHTYWRRVVIEKPFGHSWESARKLNKELGEAMTEPQIYRIDHYLGKETVQNIMVMRFANGIFEPIWNSHYIDSVQITVAESLGVESRGDYYEGSGALRDMVPNHLFQLVSLIGMEPPNSFRADDVRDEKVKLLKAIRPFSDEQVLSEVVRGQYGPGRVEEKSVPGYRSEVKVDPESQTETFVAMKLEIDNWRWAGVPFYLRTGKRLKNRLTEVVIRFRCAPFQMFRDVHPDSLNENLLVLQIQPEERIQTRFTVKVPGSGVKLADAVMDFNYVDRFGLPPQTGYETLLFDAMKGDPTLFQRADQIEAGWKIVEPILSVWHALKARNFPNYPAGSWGPEAADELLTREGRAWTVVNPSGGKAGGGEEAKPKAAKGA